MPLLTLPAPESVSPAIEHCTHHREKDHGHCARCGVAVWPDEERWDDHTCPPGYLDASDLFAVHTEDGTPINESALCGIHFLGDGQEFALAAAADAEDRPAILVFRKVANPEANDTRCVECVLP